MQPPKSPTNTVGDFRNHLYAIIMFVAPTHRRPPETNIGYNQIILTPTNRQKQHKETIEMFSV